MGIDQKRRSIFCFYASPDWTEVDGIKMIDVDDWPFELETIFQRWLATIPRDEIFDENEPHKDQLKEHPSNRTNVNQKL
jgi:hypothetical protein